jgi:hypothetical protein
MCMSVNVERSGALCIVVDRREGGEEREKEAEERGKKVDQSVDSSRTSTSVTQASTLPMCM